VAGCCKCGEESSGSWATELVSHLAQTTLRFQWVMLAVTEQSYLFHSQFDKQLYSGRKITASFVDS
jgi:hypothetical protein